MQLTGQLRGELVDQKDRLFLWLPVAFGAGIAAYFSLSFEPDAKIATLIAMMIVPALYHFWRRHHDGAVQFITYILVFAAFVFSAGFAVAGWGTKIYGSALIDKEIRITTIAGEIETIEDLGGGDGSRVVLIHPVIEKLPPEDTPRKVRLRIRKNDGLKAGQTISALAQLQPTSGPVAPGSYDFQRHLFFQGIGAVGFTYNQPVIVSEPRVGNFTQFFEYLRSAIYKNVEEQAGPATAGIMTALITGQRGAIDEVDDDAMRESGLYHLLSISGTHVSMVAASLFFVSRLLMAAWPWLALHYPIKKFAAVIALSGAVFYCLLAGADVPAVRAVLMTGLVLIAIMLDRSPFSLRLIAFAALVVLSLAPYALVGVSFQMSFAAVAALICFFDYIHPVWVRLYSRAGFLRKGALYLFGLIMTSIIAGGMTGLFGLYHFQQFAVYGVLSNMIAVPLTGLVIMPSAILALVLMPFGLDGFAFSIMEWGTVWMLAVAHWTAGLDNAVIHVAQWPLSTFVCICAGSLLLILWKGWCGKSVAALILLTGLVLPAFYKQPDILVSDGGELIGVRVQGELFLSSGRKEKFAAENWMRLAGQEGVKPKTFAAKDFPYACDVHGCRVEEGAHRLAIVYDRKAAYEDCGWASLMIGTEPVKDICPDRDHVYDLFDFQRGAYAFYFGEGARMRVRSTAAERGNRPWVR